MLFLLKSLAELEVLTVFCNGGVCGIGGKGGRNWRKRGMELAGREGGCGGGGGANGCFWAFGWAVSDNLLNFAAALNVN